MNSSQKFIYGNWKMAQSLAGVVEFLNTWSLAQSQVEVAIFPSFVHLETAGFLKSENALSLIIGAQDCSTEKEGAFTGEVSAQQIREMGCASILIGHSERRQRLPENPQSLLAKLDRALEARLKPVFCIGETEAERVAGKTFDILKTQLEVVEKRQSEILVAYEPVWAIGTGRVASVSDVEEAHRFIWKQVPRIQGLLYGGSVKPENSRELSKVEGVDGFLVGGASLKSETFAKIVESVL